MHVQFEPLVMSAVFISCSCPSMLSCSAGVVDEDYRGNVGVVLFNFGKETFDGESPEKQTLKSGRYIRLLHFSTLFTTFHLSSVVLM